MKGKIRLVLCFCICLCLMGCSFSDFKKSQIQVEDEERKQGTLGLKPDFSYEKKEQVPTILVDQLGYYPKAMKQAYFQFSEETTSLVYSLRNQKSKEEVYSGILQPLGLQEKNGKYIYVADFSEFETEGKYYFYQKNLGYSDVFTIGDQLWKPLEEDLLRKLQEQKENTVAELSYETATLLLCLELFPEQTNLWDLVTQNVEKLMTVQDPKTGSVYGEFSQNPTHESVVSLSATAQFAGVMAMYAYDVKDYDRGQFSPAVAAAEKAYRFIANSLEGIPYDLGLFATTQLYRTTGKSGYKNTVFQYLDLEESLQQYSEMDYRIFGWEAFLTSRYGVDKKRDGETMKKLLGKAEDLSKSCSRLQYSIESETDWKKYSGLLQSMMLMGVANYIIENHEYSNILQNYLHYFLGRNPYSTSFVENYGSRFFTEGDCIQDPINSSRLLFLVYGADAGNTVEVLEES